MKKFNLSLSLAFSIGMCGLQNLQAQESVPVAPPTPVVIAQPSPTPVALAAAQNVNSLSPRARREQAYGKMLEAQRYLWGFSRARSQTVAANNIRMAKQALQKAVELDPTLSEGYTALAEIALSTPPGNIEEAILLAGISSKLNADNFGAHRILARVYTIKSRLGGETLDPAAAQKAIAEWREVVRLDPRSAEAWAFLSEFYKRTNRGRERIDALRKWMAGAAALDNRFYRTILGAQENLSAESAAVKLGEALLQNGESGEAVEILSRTIADSPDNAGAIDLLRLAVESGEGRASNAALESLQSAVFADPTNTILVDLLAEMQSRLGKTDDAVKTLKSSIEAGGGDKNAIANLQVSLGDVYMLANRSVEGISSYEDSLKTFGISTVQLTTDDEREFAIRVFEKIINAYKNAGRIGEARAAIERARQLLGKADLFSDKQLVNLLRESGKKREALQAIRLIRRESSEDYSLMRLEASILTDLGKVDEAVALIKTLMTTKPPKIASPYYDNFSNYIFISTLYSQAKRPQDAVLNARQAYVAAESVEKKQLADLVLANASQQSGDYQTAEQILRNLLKKTPGNPIALNNLGYFLLERNANLPEARDLIEQAVRIDPTNASYLDSLGWANFKLGKLSEAERFLKEALRRNPVSASAHEHLGDLYEKQQKPEPAKTAWRRALALAADSEAVGRLKAKIAKF